MENSSFCEKKMDACTTTHEYDKRSCVFRNCVYSQGCE